MCIPLVYGSKSAAGTDHTTRICIPQQIFFEKLQHKPKNPCIIRANNDLVVA
jgi:hypothetical protein